MRILLVEDEIKIIQALEFSLKKAGFIVDSATNGLDGYDLALNDIYDVIILDRMLPGMDGLDILKELRKENFLTPILLLTAKDSIEDRVEGLDSGADDYLIKPFATKELIARIKALGRRRSETFIDDNLKLGNIIFNPSSCEITCEDTTISLTHKESQILEILSINKNNVISRYNLIDKVWGIDCEVESNNLEAYISYLRKKLSNLNSSIIIETVRGIGYMLKEL